MRLSSFRFFKTKKEKDFVMKRVSKGSLGALLLYILYRLRLTSFIRVKRAYYAIYLSYSPYALWLYHHPEARRKEEEFTHFFLEEGDVFVDCGAHLGTVTLTASHKVKGGGRVLSLEPHPRTYSYLVKNVSASPYKNIITKRVAVADTVSISHLSDSYVSDMNHLGTEGKEVEVTTLSLLLKSYRNIDLLKIDVEGKEFAALLGGREILTKVSAILFESAEGSFTRYEYALSDIMMLLKKHHFQVYRFPTESEKVLQAVDSAYITKTRYEDLLALSEAGKMHFQKQGGKILPLQKS